MPRSIGIIGPERKQSYIIKVPNLFYKLGIRNFRSAFQHTIESIELNIRYLDYCNEIQISKIYNQDGVIFEKLRNIYGIMDSSIIPIISEKFIPYIENIEYVIIINYNKSDDLNVIDNIGLSYEVVKIDNDLFASFQYKNNIDRIIENNSEIKNVISKLEYLTPRIEYTGSECTYSNKGIYKLCFYGYLQQLLIYNPNPNDKIIDVKYKIILDTNKEYWLPCNFISDNQFTLVNFVPGNSTDSSDIVKYCINSSLSFIEPIIYLEFEKTNNTISHFDIFGICYKPNIINNGKWIQYFSPQ